MGFNKKILTIHLGNMIRRIRNNKLLILISIIAVVLGALITIGNFFGRINDYLYLNVFVSKNISDKIDDLFAGQSINYFRQILGSEKLQRSVSEKYVEYVFQYKSAYIQTLVSKVDNEVVYWAITDCRRPILIKRPVFSHAYTGKDGFGGKMFNVFGKDVRLNNSTFTDVFKEEKGEFEYFISGATANSFAYESLYLGNPSDYMTIIIGINDVCSPQDVYKYLKFTSSNEEIERFREKAKINTYGETSPLLGSEIIALLKNQINGMGEPYITFGVDRIRVRYFNQ